jgi:predicted nucleic acid-binding protein
LIVVSEASPILDLARIGRLQFLASLARFWIGPDLYAEVLAELGES